MRVEIEKSSGVHYVGTLIGLHNDSRGDVQAVVRIDGMGLYLEVIHPSKVKVIEYKL